MLQADGLEHQSPGALNRGPPGLVLSGISIYFYISIYIYTAYTVYTAYMVYTSPPGRPPPGRRPAAARPAGRPARPGHSQAQKTSGANSCRRRPRGEKATISEKVATATMI